MGLFTSFPPSLPVRSRATLKMEVDQQVWTRIPNYDYRLEATLKITSDVSATALVTLNNPNGDSDVSVHVYVAGKHHGALLSTNKYSIHDMDDILCLNIRAFSPDAFVVFVQMKTGPWPFVCFTRGLNGDFESTVFYTVDAVSDIAVIGSRFIVVSEVVMCHRHLLLQCYDMQDTSEQMWVARSENLSEYFMMDTFFETNDDADTVADTVAVHMLCGGNHYLTMTVTEHGVVSADGQVAWKWKRPSDSDFREDPVCVVKPAVAPCQCK